jgi:hypothetical protein
VPHRGFNREGGFDTERASRSQWLGRLLACSRLLGDYRMTDCHASKRAASAQTSFEILYDYPPPGLEQRWRRFLQDADFATHYTTPEYFREPFFQGKQPFAILSLHGDEVVGVCTGIHDGRSLKCGLAERPQVAVARDADADVIATGLAAGLWKESRACSLADVFSWSQLNCMVRRGFSERRERGAIVLDLSLGADVLFRKFSQTRRTDIRNAIKAGVTVDLAASNAEVSGSYEVYREWGVRKGLPAEPWEAYEKAVSLTANRRLFVARHHGRIIASLIVRLAPGAMMEAAAIVCLENELHLHPNDLLHFRAIEWACAQGLRLYSLGGSHLFARKFGGPLVPTYRYRLDRSFLRTHTVRDVASDLMRLGAAHAPSSFVALARRLRQRARS